MAKLGDLKVLNRTGFSLLELVMVLIILTALAAVLIPLLDLNISTPGGEKTPQQIVTETNLLKLSELIMGTATTDGAWNDVGQQSRFFIREVGDLFLDLSALQSKYSAAAANFNDLTAYDPVKKLGWNGPYAIGGSEILDAWGTPIVVQIDYDGNDAISDNETKYARLVSAGPNKVLDTPVTTNDQEPGSNDSTQLTLAESGDDVILFLQVPDSRE